MKTIFLLSALAAAALAAPADPASPADLAPLTQGPGPLGEELPEPIKREKKSPSFGKGIGGVAHVPVAVVPVQHVVSPGHLGHHHSPAFGHHHHSLHQPHYFREADDNGQQLEIEALTPTRSAEIKEGKTDMEKSLGFAKAAVDDLEKDMLKIEGNQQARMQWKNVDVNSELELHENIEKAKEALDIARKSFNDLESSSRADSQPNQQPATSSTVQPLLKPVSHETKPTEKQRLAQWKENIDSVHTNGKTVTEKDVLKAKNALEMESSASTNKELFSKMDNQWHHDLQSNDMKSAVGSMDTMRTSDMETNMRAVPKPGEGFLTNEKMPGHEQRMNQFKENVQQARAHTNEQNINKGNLMKSVDNNSEIEANKPKNNIQTTELRSNTNFDDLELKKQQEQSAMNLRNDHISATGMKAAESMQHNMRPLQTLQVPHRHELENIHEAEWNQNRHLKKFNQHSEQEKSAFELHALAKSSDMPENDIKSQEHATGKSAEGGVLRQAMAEQQWRNMHQQASARSYGSGYGSSASLGGAGALVSGSGAIAGPVVGVFPNAHVGGCALPLLLSCSPSVVSGSLAHASHHEAPVDVAASYGGPAVGAALYSPASAYRSVDHLTMNKKRDTNKYNKVKVAKKTNGIPQKTRIIQSVQ